jgi:hypothetical protein|tara:strand:+ start:93 stop:560 length:468 start_codon:yes stop_codon:yes gene_type:complete
MAHSTARISLAGEYLAASYMLRYCDSVIIAPEGHKSDLILDHQGQLYKIQVKTTNSLYKKDGKDYYRWDFRSNADNKRKNKMLRYGSGQVDIFCLVALPMDKVFFLSFDEVQNSIAKSIDALNKIDSKESLLKCLLDVNKIPNLEPIDATTESNI